jgi:hypothetical protein
MMVGRAIVSFAELFFAFDLICLFISLGKKLEQNTFE